MDLARLGSVGLALLCYVPTLGLIALGILVIVERFPTVAGFLFGVPLLLFGLAVAPRFPRLSKRAVVVRRSEAPALYAVVDRAAAALRARPVNIIAVDRQCNASWGAVGIRRRRVLTIGIPLWDALTDQERITIIGHELGHEINGDLASRWLVGNALTTLEIWSYVLHPRVKGARGLTYLMLLAGRALMKPFEWLAAAAYRTELSLLYRSTQRAEYLADRFAAQLGSTAAAVGALDKLYLARPVRQTVDQARKWGKDPWAASRLFLTELPAGEWERHRRLAALTADSVDGTHPPTNLRIQLLSRANPVAGTMRVTAVESQAMDRELASARAKL
jgi:Zn-dependent protease with chaperone function